MPDIVDNASVFEPLVTGGTGTGTGTEAGVFKHLRSGQIPFYQKLSEAFRSCKVDQVL